jgi:hypothetical protein
VRCEVFTVTGVKMAVFWVVASCSLVDVYQQLTMEVAGTSETSVNFYQSKRSNIPDDSHLPTRIGGYRSMNLYLTLLELKFSLV